MSTPITRIAEEKQKKQKFTVHCTDKQKREFRTVAFNLSNMLGKSVSESALVLTMANETIKNYSEEELLQIYLKNKD